MNSDSEYAAVTPDADRPLIWHGAVRFLLAALSGWLMVVAFVRNSRMVLAAHTTALFAPSF